MKLDDYEKVREYIKLGDARLQGILVAVRTWQSGRSNPLNTVSLAMREQEIDHALIGGGNGDDEAPRLSAGPPGGLSTARDVQCPRHRGQPA